VSGAAAIEQPCALATADRIHPIAPPERRFAARFVGIRRAIGKREAEIKGDLSARYVRHGAVPYNFPGFVLIETEVDKCPDEISRLRIALAYNVINPLGQRVGCAGIVLFRAPEEGDEIACGSEAAAS
jgi:hypothetical protein